MTETWRPCPWNPEGYAVSDLGRVRNIRNGRMKRQVRSVYRARRTWNPPLIVHLYRTNDGVNEEVVKVVGRLVLEAFVGPAKAGQVCRHRDGNQDNNELSNLYWGKRDYKAFAHENRSAKITWEKAEQIRDLNARRKQLGLTQGDIGRQFGVSHTVVSEIGRGVAWCKDRPAIKGGAKKARRDDTIHHAENSGIRTYEDEWSL